MAFRTSVRGTSFDECLVFGALSEERLSGLRLSATPLVITASGPQQGVVPGFGAPRRPVYASPPACPNGMRARFGSF
jgi:hypothetical protein